MKKKNLSEASYESPSNKGFLLDQQAEEASADIINET